MVRTIDPGAWSGLSFTKFDGSAEDSFSETSLHLSLTDWRLPLMSSEAYGMIDIDAYIVEAYVSVRDAGAWIADVDISGALHNPAVVFSRMEGKSRDVCGHTTDIPPRQPALGLETWNHVLDCPQQGILVTRSHQNWVARLAILSVLAQHRKYNRFNILKINICPDNTCWQCIEPSPNTIYIA